MKKVKYSALAIIMLLIITGCGEKNLTCEYYDEEWEVNQTMSMKFKNNDMSSLEVSMEFDYITEPTNEELNSVCSQYDDVEGVSCSSSNSDSKITVKLNIDLSKVDSDYLEEMKIEELDYDSVKKNYELNEFTCE